MSDEDLDICSSIDARDVEMFISNLEDRWRKSNKRFKRVQADLLVSIEEGQV